MLKGISQKKIKWFNSSTSAAHSTFSHRVHPFGGRLCARWGPMVSTKHHLSGFHMVSDPRGVQLCVKDLLGLPVTFLLSSGPGLPGFRRRGWGNLQKLSSCRRDMGIYLKGREFSINGSH